MTAWRWAACAITALLAWPASSLDSTAREWRFEVSLDERPIGEHRYLLRSDGDARELISDASYSVRFLFINAYRYEHHARESWRGDCLELLDARTNANGTRTTVAGASRGGVFQLDGKKTTSLDACVMTFAYWNPSILTARRLLNPQTGEYVPVKVMPMGNDVLGGVVTERFRLVGEGAEPLEIDLWYTPARDWVALQARTPEGRILRYAKK
jgi:Family of unknown function (DUF6134)